MILQRRIGEELGEVLIGRHRPALEIGEAVADLYDHEIDEARHHTDEAQFGECHGEPFRPPVPHEELHERHEQCGQEDGHHEGDHDEAQLDDEVDHDPGDARDREQAPGPGAGYAHADGKSILG